jgi:hypothetical protein
MTSAIGLELGATHGPTLPEQEFVEKEREYRQTHFNHDRDARFALALNIRLVAALAYGQRPNTVNHSAQERRKLD